MPRNIQFVRFKAEKKALLNSSHDKLQRASEKSAPCSFAMHDLGFINFHICRKRITSFCMEDVEKGVIHTIESKTNRSL